MVTPSRSSNTNPFTQEFIDAGLLHNVVSHLSNPDQDNALQVSKNFCNAVSGARYLAVELLAQRPGRFTAEVVPTHAELISMGIKVPNWANVLRTLVSERPADYIPGVAERCYTQIASMESDVLRAGYCGRLGARARHNQTRTDEPGQNVGLLNKARKRGENHAYLNKSYIGQLNQDDVPHGFGHQWMSSMHDNTGTMYEGDMRNGKLHGRGVVLQDGVVSMEGTFKDGLPDGEHLIDGKPFGHSGYFRLFYEDGVLRRKVSSCGLQLEGSFNAEQKLHGYGSIKMDGAPKIDAQFVNGKLHGPAAVTYLNGSRALIHFEHGRAEGLSTISTPQQQIIQCEYKNGRLVSQVLPDGTHYMGNFLPLQQEPHGKGMKKSTNGDIVRSLFVNGKPDGKTVLESTDGSVGVFNFVHGVPDGEASIRTAAGDVTQCIYQNGRLQSKTTSDGMVYQGQFNSRRELEGAGRMIRPDGSMLVGWFHNGVPQRAAVVNQA